MSFLAAAWPDISPWADIGAWTLLKRCDRSITSELAAVASALMLAKGIVMAQSQMYLFIIMLFLGLPGHYLKLVAALVLFRCHDEVHFLLLLPHSAISKEQLIRMKLQCYSCYSVLLSSTLLVIHQSLFRISLPRQSLLPFHPQVPVLLVVMATRRRHSWFPYIDTVRQQQLDLDLQGLIKVRGESSQTSKHRVAQGYVTYKFCLLRRGKHCVHAAKCYDFSA
jgi:hypothetical protein